MVDTCVECGAEIREGDIYNECQSCGNAPVCADCCDSDGYCPPCMDARDEAKA